MKKFIFSLFFLILAFVAVYAQAPTDTTGSGGINIGGAHISWAIISAIVLGIEGILRALPTGKYASLLGLIAWVNEIIPSKKKTGTSQ